MTNQLIYGHVHFFQEVEQTVFFVNTNGVLFDAKLLNFVGFPAYCYRVVKRASTIIVSLLMIFSYQSGSSVIDELFDIICFDEVVLEIDNRIWTRAPLMNSCILDMDTPERV